jgi:hypothetical protein
MKIYRIVMLSLAAALAFPQIAGAKLPLTPQALGSVEATLDTCAKVDSASAADYKAREKAFVGDATQEELDKARSASEYKESYDSTTTTFEKTPKQDVVKACKQFLEGK